MRFLVKVPLLLLGLSFVGAGAYFLMSTYASGVAVQGNHGNVGLVRPLPMSSHVTAKGEETSNKTVTDQKSHEYPKTIPSPQVKIQSTLVQNKPVIVRGTHFVDNSDKNVEKSPKALKWQDANLNWLTTPEKALHIRSF